MKLCTLTVDYNYTDLFNSFGAQDSFILTASLNVWTTNKLLSPVMLMISTLSFKLNLLGARKLTQPLILIQERFEKSAVVQIQISVFGQITLTSLQCHCACHRESKSDEKCLGGIKSTDPQSCDQDYSKKSRKEVDESWKIWFEALRPENIFTQP